MPVLPPELRRLINRNAHRALPLAATGIGAAIYHTHSQNAPQHQSLKPNQRSELLGYTAGMLTASALSATLFRRVLTRHGQTKPIAAALGGSLLGITSAATGVYGGVTLYPLLTNRVPNANPAPPKRRAPLLPDVDTQTI